MVSYNENVRSTPYDPPFLLSLLYLKENTLEFCWAFGLVPRSAVSVMSLINDVSLSDGKMSYCRARKGPMKHEKRLCIRAVTFIEKSNMTLEEVLECLYLWVHGRSFSTIHHEIGLSSNTDVNWTSFGREVCEMSVTREVAR